MDLTIIPITNDGAPLRGLTDHSVHWAVEDSDGAPFADAHAHTEFGTVPLTDIRFAGMPLAQARLVPTLAWDDLVAAVVVHFPSGWETLLLAAIIDGEVVAVSLPTVALAPGTDGVPAGFAETLSEILNALYLDGRIDTVEDNLDAVLDIALPPGTGPDITGLDPTES